MLIFRCTVVNGDGCEESAANLGTDLLQLNVCHSHLFKVAK